MKYFIYLFIAVSMLSCKLSYPPAKFHKGQTVVIHDSVKGIVTCVSFGNEYRISYIDKNGRLDHVWLKEYELKASE